MLLECLFLRRRVAGVEMPGAIADVMGYEIVGIQTVALEYPRVYE